MANTLFDIRHIFGGRRIQDSSSSTQGRDLSCKISKCRFALGAGDARVLSCSNHICQFSLRSQTCGQDLSDRHLRKSSSFDLNDLAILLHLNFITRVQFALRKNAVCSKQLFCFLCRKCWKCICSRWEIRQPTFCRFRMPFSAITISIEANTLMRLDDVFQQASNHGLHLRRGWILSKFCFQ